LGYHGNLAYLGHEFLPERLMVSGITLPQVMPKLEDALRNLSFAKDK
jgi:hypothetical protein